MKPWSEEAASWLRLLLVSGTGSLLGRKLVHSTGGIENLWSAGDEERSDIVGVGPALLHSLKASPPDSACPILQQCEANQIRLICPDDGLWAQALNGIDDAPLLLFVKGDASVLNSEKMLAVVGARRASREGILISRPLESLPL